MDEIVAAIDRVEHAARVLDVASAYADALGTRLEVYVSPACEAALRRTLPTTSPPHVLGEDGTRTISDAAARGPADLVVLRSGSLEPGGWGVELLRAGGTPLLVVPEGSPPRVSEGPTRILAPLDASPESAAAVDEAIDLFAVPGAEVVVLHVFDEQSTPPFWDQPVHARRSWGEEFLTRRGRRPGGRIELRTGSPRDTVLEVARAEGADVIALGCSGDFSPGHANLVRHVLLHAEVPVLLVNRAGGAGRRGRDADGIR